MTQEEYDKIKIDVLDISAKTKNKLKYLGFNTFQDLHDIYWDRYSDYLMSHHFSYPLRRRIMDSVKIWMVQNASK